MMKLIPLFFILLAGCAHHPNHDTLVEPKQEEPGFNFSAYIEVVLSDFLREKKSQVSKERLEARVTKRETSFAFHTLKDEKIRVHFSQMKGCRAISKNQLRFLEVGSSTKMINDQILLVSQSQCTFTIEKETYTFISQDSVADSLTLTQIPERKIGGDLFLMYLGWEGDDPIFLINTALTPDAGSKEVADL